MVYRSGEVVEIDAFEAAVSFTAFQSLLRDEVAAVRVRNLLDPELCRDIARNIEAHESLRDHADVPGLKVLGASHFQAVRDDVIRDEYFKIGRSQMGALRRISRPHLSPFDAALAFLTQHWPAGCSLFSLPSEGDLAAMTVRIYRDGAEIEPHQDILAAESPDDLVAGGLAAQWGANIYLSMGLGGELELYETDPSEHDYRNLENGPRVVSREQLPAPTTISPAVGDMIFFPSRRVHAVSRLAVRPRE